MGASDLKAWREEWLLGVLDSRLRGNDEKCALDSRLRGNDGWGTGFPLTRE